MSNVQLSPIRCADCKLCQTSACNNLPSAGPPQCDIMFVGEAPGAQEEIQGKPFVGDAGWVLTNDILPATGLMRAKVRISNAVRCRPPDNRTPKPDEIAACRGKLWAEIESVQPRLVVLLGAVAIQSLFNMKSVKGGITAYHGHMLQHANFPNTIFMPTFHPAVLLRSWESLPIIIADINKGLGILKKEIPIQALGQYNYCTTIGRVRAYIDHLAGAQAIAFDLETTSLNPHTGKILCCSFSDRPGRGYVIPLLGRFAEPYWNEEDYLEVLSLIKQLMATGKPKIGQGGIFDILFCRALGIEVNNYAFDTLLAHHLVDENSPHNLDHLISAYTTMPMYSTELQIAREKAKKLYKICKAVKRKLNKGKEATQAEVAAINEFNPGYSLDTTVEKVISCGDNYGLIKPEDLWKYAAADADATMRVFDVLNRALDREGVRETFDNITMPMVPFIVDLRSQGIRVDKGKILATQTELETDIALDEKAVFCQLAKELGVESIETFNLNSTKQLAAQLIEQNHWPILSSTPTGAPCLDKNVMAEYAKTHKAAEFLLESRKKKKLVSDFLAGSDRQSGVLKFIDDDERIRPCYNLAGTKTGRLSATEPPIHNIPRTPACMRQCYIPDEGHWWVELDYSQLELRILMCISKDPQLIKWFAEGADVHRMVTAEILGIPPDQVTDEQRTKIGKPLNFGLIYGKTAFGLAADMRISVEEAQKYIKAYFAKLSGVCAYFDRVKADIYGRGYLQTPFKRKRRLYGANFYSVERVTRMATSPQLQRSLTAKREEIERQGVNYEVQSGGSDVLNRACPRIRQRLIDEGFKTKIVHHHHDALHSSTPPDELVTATGMMIREMEQEVPEYDDYSFPVDVKVCSAWYQVDEETTEWLKGQL